MSSIRRYIIYIILCMGLLSLLSIPFYYIFCNFVYRDYYSIKKKINSKNRFFNIYFDHFIEKNLQWRVICDNPKIKVKPGEVNIIYFTIENLSDEYIVGYSIFDVIPYNLAQFFIKIECFCFEDQLLSPKEKVVFPLLFVIDESIDNSFGQDIFIQYYFSYKKTL